LLFQNKTLLLPSPCWLWVQVMRTFSAALRVADNRSADFVNAAIIQKAWCQ